MKFTVFLNATRSAMLLRVILFLLLNINRTACRYKRWLFFFRFGFYQKKIIKPKFKKKIEIGSNRQVSVRFGFLEQKPVQTGLARFFLFDSVFSVWLGFFPFFSVWVRFGSVFLVSDLKNKNRTSRFFLNFNRFNQFFFTVRFFQLFFFIFSV
jgi:hypothetical protein